MVVVVVCKKCGVVCGVGEAWWQAWWIRVGRCARGSVRARRGPGYVQARRRRQ